MTAVQRLAALGVQVVAGSNPVAPTIEGPGSERETSGAGPFDYQIRPRWIVSISATNVFTLIGLEMYPWQPVANPRQPKRLRTFV
jgi:hypothetical protein